MIPRLASEVPPDLVATERGTLSAKRHLEAAAVPAVVLGPITRGALAIGLGLAALLLFRLPLPVLSEDLPFRLATVPLLVAFVLLGDRFGLLAALVALAGSWSGAWTDVMGDVLHVAEAWTAARLFPRLQSLAVGVLLFWCTVGVVVDVLAFGGVLDMPAAQLVLVFTAQVFSGALGAFLAEGLLRVLPRRLRILPQDTRTGLRRYFSGWVMWLVVAPGLLLTLLLGRITYSEQWRRSQAESQAAAAQAAASVAEGLDARGRVLEGIAAGLTAGETVAPAPQMLEVLRSRHPEFNRLWLSDPFGRVLASSPQVGAAPSERAPIASRSRYTVAVERPGSGERPSALRLSAPLVTALGQPAGSLEALVEGDFLSRVLQSHAGARAAVISLRSEDGTLIAEASGGPSGGQHGEARHVTRQPMPWLPWTVSLDQPLADVQRGGRNAMARLLGSFLAIAALLQLASAVLARRVALPLARMDQAAGALEAGGLGGAGLLDDLSASPIAEVHGLARRFTRMHEALAYHDVLTGLPNEKLLLDRLGVALAQAADPPRSITLLLVDLDRFRVIDSTLGHTLANEVLRKVARRLQDCVRVGDTVARVGGDEFALLLPRVGRMEEATDVALKLMDAVKRPFLVAGQDVFVTATVGISLYPRDGTEPETLLKNAVAAAYVAKEQGQDSYRRYTARIKVRDAQRMLVETGLRRALESDGLFLQYQPITDLRTGAILAGEALVRWRREDEGVLEASGFIPIAEASGLITSIDQWVMRAACQEAAAWRAAGHERRVAVNLSGRQVQEPDVVDQVRHALERAHLDPRLLEVEITEGVALRDVDHCAAVLAQLRQLGVSISVDDFGTGYSSLSFLRRFPVDRVKLDRSFVQDITHNRGDAAIATAVIAMAHGLHLTVVAEGVETEQQLDFLRDHGCDAIQGWLFSPPVGAEEFAALLAAGRRLPHA